jgi:TRAP-type transport system small permease protein
MNTSTSAIQGTGRPTWHTAWRLLDEVLTHTIHWLLIVLLSGMALVVFANVVMRYVTGGSIVWAEEVARYAMVWLTFLAAGPVLRVGGHIAIENLQDAIPRRVAQWVRAGIAFCMAGLGVAMVVMGLQYMKVAQFQLTAGTQISFAYVYAAIPVGGALLVWCTLAVMVGYVETRRFEPEDAALDSPLGVQV